MPLLFYSQIVPGQLRTAGLGSSGRDRDRNRRCVEIFQRLTVRHWLLNGMLFIQAAKNATLNPELITTFSRCKFNALNGPHVARLHYGRINKIRSKNGNRL